MCDDAVDDTLATLKFILDWFDISEMINVLLLCTKMKIYSTLMNILVMLHFPLMKWVFLK